MSDKRTETWRIESEEGEINEVTLSYAHYRWQGDYKGTLGDVAGWPRAAAAKVAAKCHMSVVSILAPGELTRAEALAAERERIATMLRNHGDDRANDAPEYAEAIYDAEALVRGERPVYAPPAGNGIVTPEEIAALRRTADGAVMAGEDHADALLAAVVKIEKLQSMLAAARAEGAGAMRDATVAAVRRRAEELDASVTDEEAADDEEGYGRFQEALELVEVLGALPIPEATNTETK